LQPARLGVLPSLSNADGSSLTARPNVIGYGCQARPKTLPKGVIALGVAGQPNPKHFKKVLGLPVQLDPSILGLATQQYPRILDRAPQPDPRIMGLGCFALFSDLNLFFIQ
jgi:hypothetical protein